MPRYGDKDYWQDRYASEDTPFDWLFHYEDVKHIINGAVDRSSKILIPGCGNSMLGIEMHDDGYLDTLSTDLSEEAIQKQRGFAGDRSVCFEVMDVEDMPLEDHVYDAVIEKSLLDAILCADNSNVHCERMMRELYRVLKPGGVYIGWSLHTKDDMEPWYRLDGFKWAVTVSRLQNPRWDEDENRDRSKYYTVLVAHKTKDESLPIEATWKVLPPPEDDDEEEPGGLGHMEVESDSEGEGAVVDTDPLRASLRAATVPELMMLLDAALSSYAREKFAS